MGRSVEGRNDREMSVCMGLWIQRLWMGLWMGELVGGWGEMTDE